MANRLTRPIMFAFEANTTFTFAKVAFGAAGAPTLDTVNSKGTCNFALNVNAITGDITALSATVDNVSSFDGIYVGMSITGTGIPALTTVSAIDTTLGTITLSANATATTVGLAISVSGAGQYALTFGSQFTPFKRLDAYYKMLDCHHSWDMGAEPGVVPAAPAMFIAKNNTQNGMVANLILQFGYYNATGVFVAAAPADGAVVRIATTFANSSAI